MFAGWKVGKFRDASLGEHPIDSNHGSHPPAVGFEVSDGMICEPWGQGIMN
jgi:hypothetical protein